MRASERSLDVIDAIAQRLVSTLDLDQVLVAIVETMTGELGAAHAAIWLFDGAALRHRAGTAMQAPIAQIAELQSPILIHDPATDRRLEGAWIEGERVASFAGYPLVFDGAAIGVLAMCTRHPITAEATYALARFAPWAAIAVRNARLFTSAS